MFYNDKVRGELLSLENISNTSKGVEKVLQISISVLDKLAHQKKNTT